MSNLQQFLQQRFQEQLARTQARQEEFVRLQQQRQGTGTQPAAGYPQPGQPLNMSPYNSQMTTQPLQAVNPGLTLAMPQPVYLNAAPILQPGRAATIPLRNPNPDPILIDSDEEDRQIKVKEQELASLKQKKQEREQQALADLKKRQDDDAKALKALRSTPVDKTTSVKSMVVGALTSLIQSMTGSGSDGETDPTASGKKENKLKKKMISSRSPSPVPLKKKKKASLIVPTMDRADWLKVMAEIDDIKSNFANKNVGTFIAAKRQDLAGWLTTKKDLKRQYQKAIKEMHDDKWGYPVYILRYEAGLDPTKYDPTTEDYYQSFLEDMGFPKDFDGDTNAIDAVKAHYATMP